MKRSLVEESANSEKKTGLLHQVEQILQYVAIQIVGMELPCIAFELAAHRHRTRPKDTLIFESTFLWSHGRHWYTHSCKVLGRERNRGDPNKLAFVSSKRADYSGTGQRR